MSLLLADDRKNISGCVIDMRLECDGRFPEDTRNIDRGTSTDIQMPSCWFWKLDVTVLSGDIEVSPFMLAAYSGIATRNSGLNDLFEKDNARIAINSLAAAYVVTRELVPGTVAYEEVRAVVGLSYFCFMILPLLSILPLMCVITRGSPPPVPLSTWD